MNRLSKLGNQSLNHKYFQHNRQGKLLGTARDQTAISDGACIETFTEIFKTCWQFSSEFASFGKRQAQKIIPSLNNSKTVVGFRNMTRSKLKIFGSPKSYIFHISFSALQAGRLQLSGESILWMISARTSRYIAAHWLKSCHHSHCGNIT